MNIEKNRLKTFATWPANAAVDAARIAKAGFYYTGRALEVQCFLCGTTISEWNYGDQVMTRHRQAEPDCPFVKNPLSTCNVPYVPSVTANYTSSPIQSSTSSSLTSSSEASQSNPENNAASYSLLATCSFHNQALQKEYRTMTQRLRSFENWQTSSKVTPEKLASAGFYYLKQGDMVSCAFCGGVMMNWKPGEDPDKKHRMYFPMCDFYMRIYDEDAPDLTELGIQIHTTRWKLKHVTYEARLKTFQNWPKNVKQTPEMLSNAGFYYTGTGDEVRCFHCDGGLRDWDPTDDVWVEHAKWFPRCGYVNLVKGQEYVQQCVASRPPLDPSILAGVAEDEAADVTETSPTSTLTDFPVDQEATSSENERLLLLNSGPVKIALGIGLNEGRVRRAVKKRMEEIGVPYTNADDLIEDVLHEQSLEEFGAEDEESNLVPSELNGLLDRLVIRNNFTELSNNAENSNIHPDATGNNVTNVCEGKQNAEIPKVSETSEKGNSIAEKNVNGKLNDASSLEEENRKLKEARLCKICMDCEVAVVFLPCGHLATCVLCAPSLSYCPMCRQEIRATVRTFLS